MRLPDPSPGAIDWWKVGRTLAARGLTRHPAEIMGWTLPEVALGMQAVEDDDKATPPAGHIIVSDEDVVAISKRAHSMTGAERLAAARAARDD